MGRGARRHLDLAAYRALVIVVVGIFFHVREVEYFVFEEANVLVVLDGGKAEGVWGCVGKEDLRAGL